MRKGGRNIGVTFFPPPPHQRRFGIGNNNHNQGQGNNRFLNSKASSHNPNQIIRKNNGQNQNHNYQSRELGTPCQTRGKPNNPCQPCISPLNVIKPCQPCQQPCQPCQQPSQPCEPCQPCQPCITLNPCQPTMNINSSQSLYSLWPSLDRPGRCTVVGKNISNSLETHPGKDSISGHFSGWPLYIYIPTECEFFYVPIFLWFLATPLPSFSSTPVSGVIECRWLLYKKTPESFESVVKFHDVDAPLFFIDSAPPESTYLENPNMHKPETLAELRPLQTTPIPQWYVVDKDMFGSLIKVEFCLSILQHSTRFRFKWQLQIGHNSSWTVSDALIKCRQ